MTVLVSSLWPELAAALALGLAIGAVTGLPRGRIAMMAAGLLLLGLAALTGLAIWQVLPGAAGFRIEAGALVLGAYLAGCGVGGLGRLAARRAS